MWLYEVAILISDCPQNTMDMITGGNAESMVSMQVSFNHILNCIFMYIYIYSIYNSIIIVNHIFNIYYINILSLYI